MATRPPGRHAESNDAEGVELLKVIIDRVAGLDMHKNTVMAAVRTPDGKGGRSQTVREFKTITAELERLREWLVVQGVTQAVMEASGVYWSRPGTSWRARRAWS